MASNITPDMPNVPSPEGPGVHPFKKHGTFAAANNVQGCTPPKVLYQAPIAPSLQSYIVFYVTMAGLLYAIAPPLFEKTHHLIRSWLGLKNTNINKLNKQEFDRVIAIVESYNKKSLQKEQARFLLANLSVFKEQEIDQLLNLHSDAINNQSG